jgi:hypothetical protein
MDSAGLSWRDRLLLLNGVLFCLLGAAFIARYLMGQMPSAGAILGVALLVYGGYRLVLAGKEWRKRAAGSGSR